MRIPQQATENIHPLEKPPHESSYRFEPSTEIFLSHRIILTVVSATPPVFPKIAPTFNPIPEWNGIHMC